MRPGRSWSLGKGNVLSPLTDQVAPAPLPPPPPASSDEVLRGPSAREATEGKQTILLYINTLHITSVGGIHYSMYIVSLIHTLHLQCEMGSGHGE